MSESAVNTAMPEKKQRSKAINTDFEVHSLDKEDPVLADGATAAAGPWWHRGKYLAAGIFFGIILVKSQVVAWWRIQEMFRLKSFFMYGVLGSAVLVGAISVALIKKYSIKTLRGESIHFYPKAYSKGQVFGGLLFGLGWAITGACPGPLFAQIGAGFTVVSVTLLSAIAGTWVYGAIRAHLPH